MMRKFIGFLMILGTIWAVKQGYFFWQVFKSHASQYQSSGIVHAAEAGSGSQLAGLPEGLENSLHIAETHGAAALKKWLNYYGPQISDPRLAWIELDYVVMVSGEDMAEARQVFSAVKARTSRNSPVYERIKRLEQAYE